MDTFLQDIRHSLRVLIKSPGFTAVALATLTLGIGATTAVFGVVHATLLRPLPYPDADRLVRVRAVSTPLRQPDSTFTVATPRW